MNNGKVRIYELSKELDLDNKDILTVCADLNISVKSHSSTITENEAERIRAAAPKYSSSHSSPSRLPSSGQGATSPSKEPVSKPVVKKQQILEIRKHQTPPPGSNPQSLGLSGDPLSQPPGPSYSQSTTSSTQIQPPVRPTAPNRPTRPPVDRATDIPSEELESSAEGDFEPTAAEDNLTFEQADAVEVPNAPLEQPYIDSAATANKPTLSEPPARPNSGPIDGPSPRSNMPNRPVLKAKGERTNAPTPPPVKPVVGKGPQTQSGSSAEPPERRQRRPVTAEGGNGQPFPKPQAAIPELRRPQPVRPNATQGSSEEEGSNRGRKETDENRVLSPVELEELQLRRLTPPRPPKRLKEREEEEDELQEFPQKKAGTKTKRRNQPLLEDELDEDFVDDELGVPEPTVQVSLSLARPAKPKGRPSQAKPVATPATMAPKSKKPGSRDSEGSSSRNRRDRREEVKQERPQKIVLTGSLTVQELASILAVPETDLIKALFYKGIAANINQTLDIATASMLAQELEVEVETAEKASEARKVTEMLDAGDLEKLQRRPPVVTIMGHVDHGKTTLLDSIRKTKVAQGEAGGITQHIGAYHVDMEHEGQTQQVVFLDTPGHQAFTAMRARGARVTDIAVLVVAADDGVQPQTVEAVSHAKAAGVPIVVAINKIDKEGAQPDRVKQELTEYGLLAEEWGGDTIMVPVSAMTGDNLDTLLEMLLLVAEVEDLYANPDRAAKGTVIEAHLDKAKGPVATLLVQNGTLRIGDILVAGSALGKVRAMVDDRGKRVEVASPSFAVEVLGLGDVPAAGDDFEVFQDEKEARAVASERSDQQRQSRLQQRAMSGRQVTLNTLSARAQEGELKELNLILKADVQGSVEAILGALQQLPQREVQVRVLLAAPGEITETDVDLAAASDAVILGFNTTLASGARQAADQAGVDVRDYNIIYKLLDDIQGAMEGLLEPELVEEPLGQVEVRAVFPVGRGSVAGCYVLSGKIIRNCNVRVRRNNAVIHEGNLDSLKRMKEDAKEVNAGYECGIGLNSFHDWVEGDIIEAFRMVTKRRTLSAN